jgi:hypothetical protein
MASQAALIVIAIKRETIEEQEPVGVKTAVGPILKFHYRCISLRIGVRKVLAILDCPVETYLQMIN